MSDSQPLDSRERTSKQPPRHEKISTPALACVASPSPAKARRRPATERPSLQSANMAPVKLPSELFAIATSRSVQGDLALSKALDGIQAAATRLETERTKLVIQSQELQIWDMAREEELVLLRAENEQLEQQLAAVADKVGKGIGRDGVLEGLQYALRKARMERDAEMREADSLFNQLQEAKAAAMELQELRTAFSAALSSLRDGWSSIPLLSPEARELRAKADAAVQDPTNLGHKQIATLLRGLLALASRGSELQHEAQTLRGEKAALQQALDAAHQQLSEQVELLATHPRQAASMPHQVEPAAGPGRHNHGSEPGKLNPGHTCKEDRLRQQVSELQAKLEEYRSYLQDNQEEIEGLQAEVKRLRQASSHASQGAVAQVRIGPLHAAAPRGQSRYGALGGSSCTANGTQVIAQPAGSAWRQQTEQQPTKPPSAPQPVVGTPTRHVPSSASPISTVNYGGSPPLAASSPARASPMSQPVATDFALKVAELQELAIRAQQQAVEREAEIMRQQDEALEALRQQLVQQKDAELAELSQQQAKALAEAQRCEMELGRQHSRALADLEAQAAKQAAQHAEALAELNGMMAKLVEQHAQALVEREAALTTELQQRLRECEMDLQRQHADSLAAQADATEARLAVALAAQAAELAKQHAQERREAEERQGAQAAARLHELELALEQRFSDQLAVRDAEVRRKHAERLGEQAAQLAQLHAEQLAQLQMQHAEAIADREAELLDQYERQLVEREGQLANAHADQLRDLEARFTAQAAEAADAREAQFADQLTQALRQQQETLEAAHAAARTQETERAAAAAEQVRVAHAHEVARVARQAQEYMRRREEEMVTLLEEQHRHLELLEQQITIAEWESQAAQAAGAARDGAYLGSLTPGDDADVDRPPTDNQVWRLAAEQSEQVQQLADELEVVRDEAERRREQDVADAERKYVEVVARLGREHEKATEEARTAHELRESNLRRMLERQAEEARDAELRHKEQIERLQSQIVEIRTSLVEERERNNSSITALEERAARLATELDAARRREAEALRVLAASRLAGHVQQIGLGSSLVQAADSTGACLSPVRTPFTAVSTGAAPTTAEPSIGPADSWSDGQALQWPASAHVSTSAFGSGRNSSTGGGTGVSVPVTMTLAVSTTAPGDENPVSEGPPRHTGGVQRVRGAGEREDAWGEFVCAPQGAIGQGSGRDILRPTPGSSAPTGTGAVAAGCGSAAAAAGPGYVSEPATSVSTDTEYNSDTEFYVDDEDDEEHRGRALAAALAQSPRGSQVEFPLQLPPLLQEAQLQRRRPRSPCTVVADTCPIQGPDQDTYIDIVTGAGRTPAASFIVKDSKGAETKSGLSASETTEASVVDDLEATFWGVFPAVDMKANRSGVLGLATVAAAVAAQPAAETAVALVTAAATAAPPVDVLGAVDLEATLSGNFPALPQLLSTLQHHLPLLLPAEDGKVNEEPGDGDGSTYHSAVLALPPSAVPFSFPGPQGSAAEWDGTSFCSGNQLAALSDREQEERSRAVVEVPKELIDLASSFCFSPGVQLGSCTGPPAPTQQAEPPDNSMAPSDSMEEQELHGRVEDSACMMAQTADAGVSYTKDKKGLGDWGGSARSSAICSLPPLPRIQAPVQSPNRQVWVDLTDDEESSIVDDDDDDGAKDSAFGSRAQDGSIWPPAPAAARAAAGITPLLVPNPLFNETDEVSPPWSAAEWSTGRSPLTNEIQTEGASLPSTPGNETRECSSSSISSDDLADCNTAGLTAAGAISYEAWNTLYDMPEEHSSPDSEMRGFFHEQAVDRCPSSENTRSGNPGCSQGSGSVESAETTPQQRRGEDGGDECRSCRGGGAQRALEAGQQTDEETGGHREERQSSHGARDSEEDDMRSLLAAGATLSNSERRRRQRRRMGDAPVGPPLEHPIDLLRQGWEFSGGVASPISPRSTPQEFTPADAPWQESPTQHTAPATASPNGKRSQREGQQLEQLLPLHALHRDRNSPSPARRSGISTPSPRASPLSKSPVSSTSALGRTGGSTGAASARLFTDMPALEASPGALSALACATPSSAVVGRPLSPLEVRQRSRALLGRARSRVAELEDQCRALAASLHPSPIDDTAAAAFSPPSVGLPVTGSRQATPGLLWRSSVMDQQGASSGGQGVLFEQCEPKIVEATVGNRDSSCSSITMVAMQPAAAPAEVVDALEDLRGDLNELEALHRLATRATKHYHSAEGISPGALTSPEPRPAGLLLDGLAGGAAATAVALTDRAHVGSPIPDDRRIQALQQAASPQGGLRSPGIHAASSSSQVENGKWGAIHTPHNIATDQSATDPQSTGPQPARLSATDADYSARSTPEPDDVAGVGPQAASPLPQDGCTWPVRDSASSVAAALPPAARSPVPSVPGASSLDPGLVALLQLSIQAQVQGQLGQLEAKIAELQRQNEALLAAATAASTPATPLPPHFRYSGHFGPATMTPLPPSPPSAVLDASRGSGAIAGANEGGRGQPLTGDTPAVSWSGSLDGLWLRGGRGVALSSSADQFRTLLEAWPKFPAAWESTPSPQPSVVTASGGSQGRVPARAVSLASGTVPTAQPLVTAVTAVTPADAGRKVSASAEVVAGPFSPEELSQLPPTVQIFAPPQLRAAALAAVREQAQANRHAL